MGPIEQDRDHDLISFCRGDAYIHQWKRAAIAPLLLLRFCDGAQQKGADPHCLVDREGDDVAGFRADRHALAIGGCADRVQRIEINLHGVLP